jgi:hypothetical protein
MKRIAIALLATVGLAAAHSARADTSVRIGVNIGAPVYRHAPAPVVVAPPPAVVYAPRAPVVVVPARGYWKDVQVKTWVPERWVVRHNRWGRAERYCEPGYYTYATQRVWVDSHDHRGHGPDHRGYGHDNRYGHDDRRDHHNGWRR